MTLTNITTNICKTLLIAIGLLIPGNVLALPQNYYTKQSVLSSGNWVKIRVDREGLYQVTYDQLRQWGFSDPERVSVYGYGGAALASKQHSTMLPDDLTRQYTHHDKGSARLFFYGEGSTRTVANSMSKISLMRNYWHDYGYYFLSDCDLLYAPAEAEEIVNDQHYKINTHVRAVFVENDVQNPAEAGVFFHDTPMEKGETRYITFNINDYDDSEHDQSYFEYSFGARGYHDTQLLIGFPSTLMLESSYEGKAPYLVSETNRYKTSDGHAYFSPTSESMPDGPVRFSLTNPADESQFYCAIDKVGFAYPRKNIMSDDGSQIMMDFNEVNQAYDFVIQNANSSVVVMNASDPTRVYHQQTYYKASERTMSGTFDRLYREATNEPCRLIAFDPASAVEAYAPEFVEKVEPQNIHGCPVPQMLIITTKTLKPAADELAEIHRRHGLDCLVVVQDQVFNEFSSGTPTIFAYNRLAKMFYDRDKDRFKYVLLYGTGSWDNRSIQTPQTDRLLTYQCEYEPYATEETTNFTHDGYVGMFIDNFDNLKILTTPHDIAVGRIPASDLVNARSVNTKIDEYLTNPPTAEMFTHVIVSSDDGNNSTHLEHSENTVTEMKKLNPALSFMRGHDMLYPWQNKEAVIGREHILTALESGAGYLTYAGHGNPTAFTAEKLWTLNSVSSSSYTNPPFAMFSTCDAFDFDKAPNGITEAMMLKQDGGAIGIIAACRSVYMLPNQLFSNCVARNYASARAGTTIGDVFRNAHNEIVTEANQPYAYCVNTLCYNLCGDPSIPISAPSHNIRLTRIDDVDISAVNPFDTLTMVAKNTITPLQPVKLSGQITDFDGEDVYDFTGTATITIYEAPLSTKTLVQNPDDARYDKPRPITVDQDVLARSTATIVGGAFDATFVVPAPMRPGGLNRIVVTAQSPDNKRATGFYRLSSVVDADTEVSATPAQITAMYLDSPSFCDGDVVGNTPTLYATVTAGNMGINFSSTIGATPAVRLDAKRSYANASSFIHADTQNPDNWLVNLPLSDLSDGFHTLTLSIPDNAGNITTQSLTFNVNSSLSQASLKLEPNTNRDKATLLINYEGLNAESSYHIIIEDALGNCVFSRTVSNPSDTFDWELVDNDGKLVPDGHYSAYYIATIGNNHASSPRIEIPVVH